MNQWTFRHSALKRPMNASMKGVVSRLAGPGEVRPVTSSAVATIGPSELVRKVQGDCAIEVDTNTYYVPWRLIGENVQISVSAGRVRIHHTGRLVADHAEVVRRHGRIVEPSHLAGTQSLPRPAPRPVPEETRRPIPLRTERAETHIFCVHRNSGIIDNLLMEVAGADRVSPS
jgi:hypothetical protein